MEGERVVDRYSRTQLRLVGDCNIWRAGRTNYGKIISSRCWSLLIHSQGLYLIKGT